MIPILKGGTRGKAPVGSGGGGGGLLTPVARMEWDGATGFSEAALRDTGGSGDPWDSGSLNVNDSNLQLIVVNAATEGISNWPTTNALKVRRNNGSNAAEIPRWANIGPEISVGSSRTYRYYVNVTIPSGQGLEANHPLQDGNSVASMSHGFLVYGPLSSGTKWQPRLNLPNDLTNGKNLWSPPFNGSNWMLDVDVTYRIELTHSRLTSTTSEFDLRIYLASTGALLRDGDDFDNDLQGDGLLTLKGTTITIGSRGGVTDEFQSGINGWNSANSDHDYMYQGGIAIVDGLYVGPYGSVIGES